jgi:hypothetical protein
MIRNLSSSMCPPQGSILKNASALASSSMGGPAHYVRFRTKLGYRLDGRLCWLYRSSRPHSGTSLVTLELLFLSQPTHTHLRRL